MILAAIEIPNLWRARMAANQAAAVASMQAIATAEAIYAATYGHGYTTDLSQLGPPPAGQQASSSAADLIDPLLAKGLKGGYQYVYIAGPVDDGKVTSYTIKSAPSVPCVTAVSYYTLDSSAPSTVSPQSLQSMTQTDSLTQIVDHTIGGGTAGSGSAFCGGP